jgi:hypothetical protein
VTKTTGRVRVAEVHPTLLQKHVNTNYKLNELPGKKFPIFYDFKEILQMISALGRKLRDLRDISAIWKGP